MRNGTLSVQAAERLLGDKTQEGLRVQYEPHPKAMVAKNIYRESDGKFLGGYVSVGPDGIIDSEGRP